MKIAQKTLFILGITVFTLIIVLSVILQITISSGFENFERNDAFTNLQRSIDTISSEIERMDRINLDWSQWDETYQFSQDENTNYLESNLNPKVLRDLRINSLIILNESQFPIYMGAYDLTNMNEVKISEEIVNYFSNNPSLFRFSDPAGKRSGIAEVNHSLIFYSAQPITKTDGSGPVKGTFIMVRNIDQSEISELKKTLHLNLSVQPVTPEDVIKSQGTKILSYNAIPIIITPVNMNTITGTALLADAGGHPVLNLTLDLDRFIVNQGRISFNYIIIALIIISSIFLIVLFVLIYLYIIKPLSMLAKRVNEIEQGQTLSLRMNMNRNDELGSFAMALDRMLASLEEKENALIHSKRRYRDLVNLAEEGICVVRDEGKIAFSNPRMAEMLGYTIKEMTDMDFSRLLDNKNRDRKLPYLTPGPTEYMALLTKSGEKVCVKVVTSVVSFFPLKNTGTLAVITDITDLRKTEGKLDLANRKILLLASITRHDILNKLETLRGFLLIAKEKSTDLEVIRAISIADESADKIRHQLVFSKEYQNMGIKLPVWLSVYETVEKAASLLGSQKFTLVVNNCDYSVFADPMLEKVFYNLFDNSIQHGIHVTRIQVECKETEDYLNIIVEDDGAGIPANEKGRLFLTECRKGWGLFLSKEVLQITGMTIEESGKSGKGARFIIKVQKEGYKRVVALNKEPESDPGNNKHDS